MDIDSLEQEYSNIFVTRSIDSSFVKISFLISFSSQVQFEKLKFYSP